MASITWRNLLKQIEERKLLDEPALFSIREDKNYRVCWDFKEISNYGTAGFQYFRIPEEDNIDESI